MSSVPKATSQTVTNPTSMAVTTATDKQLQAEDVDRKLRLYGMFTAFSKGNMPTNAQIDSYLEYALKHSAVDTKKLSPDGQQLIEDVQDIISTLREIVKDKNSDELLQNFVYDTTVTDTSRGAQSKDALPVSKGEIKKDASNAGVHLRTLLTLLLTNSESRKMISDLGIIGRDIFASAAVKAAEAARPDEDALNQVDREAPSKEWKGADGHTLGPDETPKLEVNLPGGHKVVHDPKAPIAHGTVHTDPDGNETTAGEAYDKAQQKKEEAKSKAAEAKDQAANQGPGVVDQAKQKAAEGKQEFDNNGVDGVKAKADRETPSGGEVEEKKKGLKHHFNNFKEKLSNSDAADNVTAKKDKTIDFLDEQFPEERRDQFIYRAKKVIVDCQSHKDYDEAVNFFLEKFETYSSHGTSLAGTGADSVGAVTDDPAFQRAFLEMKLLLERFANNTSLDGVFKAVDQIYQDVKEDDELREWFSSFDAWIRKTLLEPGWVLEDECAEEGTKLRESGKRFFDVKYKGHKDTLFDEISTWFTAFAEDPLNKSFGEDWKRLTKDILFDSEGKLAFKPQLWTDIRQEILPQVISKIGYIPIPKVEYTDDKIDLVIENLVLQGANIFPNIIELEANNFFKFSPYKGIKDQSHHRFRVGFSQIHADMRDVAFYFKKKSGFPKLKDSGLADVLIAGKGISVDVELETNNRKDSVFSIKKVYANVDTLKFAVRDSKHDFLYKVVAPLAQGLIKKAVGIAIEQALKTGLEYVDEQLAEVRNKMDEAKNDDEATRTQALKDLYARKKQTAKENAKKADDKTGDFAIVTSPDKELLPNADLPKSFTNTAFEKLNLAKSGDKWRSPAFDVVGKQTVAKQ